MCTILQHSWGRIRVLVIIWPMIFSWTNSSIRKLYQFCVLSRLFEFAFQIPQGKVKVLPISRLIFHFLPPIFKPWLGSWPDISHQTASSCWWFCFCYRYWTPRCYIFFQWNLKFRNRNPSCKHCFCWWTFVGTSFGRLPRTTKIAGG